MPSATSPMLVSRFSRPALLLICGGAAIVLGFFAVEPPTALAWIKHGGAWIMLLTFVVLLWSLGQVVKRSGIRWPRGRGAWTPALSIPLGWIVLLVHEPFGFKIVMDEILLLGTSMSLHFDRLVRVPLRGHDLQGAFVIVDGFVDKRPYFFPFLLSLVHDVSGYRPENAFVLNAVLAGVLLTLVYGLGCLLAGRLAGAAAVLLLSGLPLLAQCATGGGFDLLNLVMIVLVFGLAHRFVATRAAPELTALCYATVLLAQTRYESVIFVVPVAALILWVWWREQHIVLSWPAAVTPLLLLPVPWLLSKYRGNGPAWEMASQPDAGTSMSLSYVGANVRHALAFFFDGTGGQSSSLLFSALGVAALAGLVIWWLRRARGGATPPAATDVVAVAFVAALAGHAGLMMAYFWGRFDDPVISRLSLPTHFLFLLALWLAVPAGRVGQRIWLGLVVLAAAQLWSLSIPRMAAHAETSANVYAREVEWRREFIARRGAKDFLAIDPYSVVWLTHGIPSTSIAQALQQPAAIAFHLRNHSFAEILVFQRFEIDPATGAARVRPEFDVGGTFTLTPVAERRLQPYTLSRLSRITAVHDGDHAAPP
jgi:hypothetical protein